MKNQNLPKVLILNEVFNSNTGGGITLSNLFSGWDSDKIAVLSQSYLLRNADDSICNTYYQLGDQERKYRFPFNLFSSKYESGLIKIGKNTEIAQPTSRSSIREKVILNYVIPFMRYVGLTYSAVKIQLSDELKTWLTSYDPDVIYAQAHDLEGVLLVLLVKEFLKKPLVFHMMDDWPSVVMGNKFLTAKHYRLTDIKFRELLNESDLLMSISEEMADEYKKRYNKDFKTFHNPIDINFWKKYQRTDYELSKSPSILYAGRLGLGIDDSLELVGKVIQKINQDLNLSLTFVLQVKERPQWSVGLDCVEHKTFVEYDQLPKAFAEADLLLLPYDFSPLSLQFIGFSMPTKATEYMISGTPIIILAPATTALAKYAIKFNWAKVITVNDFSVVYDAFKSLVMNINERREIAKNAITVAEENHSSVKITEQFRTMLGSLVN